MYNGGGEVEGAGRRMNGADGEFGDDLCQHLTSHCDAPVFDAVVHRCELCTTSTHCIDPHSLTHIHSHSHSLSTVADSKTTLHTNTLQIWHCWFFFRCM